MSASSGKSNPTAIGQYSTKSSGRIGELTATERWERCYNKPVSLPKKNCDNNYLWQRAKYRRDSCGSGLVPYVHDFKTSRNLWCQTPLSSYQATIGEIGRQVLCREIELKRDVLPEPPCGVCVNILQPCRGYYRKYPCIRPCEEEFAVVKGGKRTYRPLDQQYWQPCFNAERLPLNILAPHNVSLGMNLEKRRDLDCNK